MTTIFEATCPLCDGLPTNRGRRFKCQKHPFLTEAIWKAADQKQQDIMNRVETFQEDLTQEAEHELTVEFKSLTDQQAYEIMGVV